MKDTSSPDKGSSDKGSLDKGSTDIGSPDNSSSDTSSRQKLETKAHRCLRHAHTYIRMYIRNHAHRHIYIMNTIVLHMSAFAHTRTCNSMSTTRMTLHKASTSIHLFLSCPLPFFVCVCVCVCVCARARLPVSIICM